MINYDEERGGKVTLPQGHRLLGYDHALTTKECEVTLHFGTPALGRLRRKSPWDYMARHENLQKGIERRNAAIEKEEATAIDIVFDYADFTDFKAAMKEIS